jgi:hypothetical protein
MLIAKTSAVVGRYSISVLLLAVPTHRPALAQCGGGGGMSCGGHSMSGHDMGTASHAGDPSMAHSPTGHNPGASSWSHIRNQPLEVPGTSNWMMPSGHSAHGSAVGTGGISPRWSSPPFGFRSDSPRLFSGLAEPTIRSRASAAYHTPLPEHALSRWNSTDTSAGRVGRGVDDRAPDALPRLQRTISSPSLPPRIPSADPDGIRFDNHSAHQPHQGLTSDPCPGWAAKLRSQTQSDLSLPGSLGSRSQTNQTTLLTSRLRSLDSSHASHSRPNPSARFETGVPPTSDWTLGGASGTRPVFRPSLDSYSAIELPATRGLEDFMAQSHNVPATQPTN